MRKLLAELWIPILLFTGLACMATVAVFSPGPSPVAEVRTAPSFQLDDYYIIALDDSCRVCKMVDVEHVQCSPFIPDGSMLLIPRGPQPLHPDST